MPPQTKSLDIAHRRSTETSRTNPLFLRDVVTGLGQEHKAIPSRWFYDSRGSEIF